MISAFQNPGRNYDEVYQMFVDMGFFEDKVRTEKNKGNAKARKPGLDEMGPGSDLPTPKRGPRSSGGRPGTRTIRKKR